jgi:hypothetical protein
MLIMITPARPLRLPGLMDHQAELMPEGKVAAL